MLRCDQNDGNYYKRSATHQEELDVTFEAQRRVGMTMQRVRACDRKPWEPEVKVLAVSAAAAVEPSAAAVEAPAAEPAAAAAAVAIAPGLTAERHA